MPSTRSLRERVEGRLADYLRVHQQAGQRILVACSGGSDSTALLAASAAIAPRLGLKVLACRLDHGLRPRAELEAEAALLGTVCLKLGVDLEVRSLARGRVEALARRRACGIEAAARSLRRATLLEVARGSGASLILLGHTCDDQAETLLMRLLSGAGAAGLRGMAALSGPFARPFLGLAKRDLKAYLELRGLAWTEDSTNASDDFARNRFRHDLVPALDRSAPGWRRALAGVAAKAALDEEALAAQATTLAWRLGASGPCADAAEAARLPQAALIRALASALNASGAARGVDEGERLPWGFLAAASKATRAGKPFDLACSGARVLSDGVTVEARALPRRPEPADGATKDAPSSGAGSGEVGVTLRITGPGAIYVGKAEVLRVYWTEGGAVGIPEGSFEFPLLLRTRRPGDPPHTGGGFGSKAVPLFVAEDAHGVVCLIGEPAGAPDLPKRDYSPDARRLAIAKGTDPYAWV